MTELINDDIIHLQHAHITQYTDDNKKSDWNVRKNITNEDLAKLPKEFTEKQVFKIMAFARKFEMMAFNEGIQFGKQKERDSNKSRIENYERTLTLARQENERLAEKLIKLISKET